MGSRFLRHAHRGSLAGNGRTRGRRFSAKVDFGDLISDESQKNNCTTVSSGRWGLRSDFGDRLVVEVVLGVTLAEKWRKVSAHFFRQSRTLDLMWKWPENGRKQQKKSRNFFGAFCVIYYLLLLNGMINHKERQQDQCLFRTKWGKMCHFDIYTYHHFHCNSFI